MIHVSQEKTVCVSVIFLANFFSGYGYAVKYWSGYFDSRPCYYQSLSGVYKLKSNTIC